MSNNYFGYSKAELHAIVKLADGKMDMPAAAAAATEELEKNLPFNYFEIFFVSNFLMPRQSLE